jgi:hypothetical protein
VIFAPFHTPEKLCGAVVVQATMKAGTLELADFMSKVVCLGL